MTDFTKKVAASLDDADVSNDGFDYYIDVTATNHRVGWAAAGTCKQGGGIRFQNVTIPKDATINAMHVHRFAYGDNAVDTVNSRWHGQLSANATAFVQEFPCTDYTNRPRTVAVVDEDAIAHWLNGEQHDSPELKTIGQEIVNQALWVSGNALVLFWDDADDRSSHNAGCIRAICAWDSTFDALFPELHVTYTSGGITISIIAKADKLMQAGLL